MSYFDDELTDMLNRKGIDYKILTNEEHEKITSIIQKKISFIGAQISWTKLNNAKNFNNLIKNEALNTIADMLSKLRTNCVIFLGDSAIDHAYSVGTNDIKSTLEIIADIPQHSYIFPEDLSWVACISLEGYIDCADLSRN